VSREELLSRTFVELADTLVNGYDVVDLLHLLATRCVELADVDAAGIVLADLSGTLRVASASSEDMHLLELFEVQNDEGPCYDSYHSGEAISADLVDSDRWPRLRVEAIRLGFQSVVAIPLRLRHDPIGALNLFSKGRGPLGPADVVVCQALADMATIGLLQQRAMTEARVLAEQLQGALDSRVIIEQAKGVLSERAGVDMDAAFNLLRSFARNRNRLLGDVARELIDGRLAHDLLVT
jgi:transcriptional regulator with GAF, ATPase, and Fis domain